MKLAYLFDYCQKLYKGSPHEKLEGEGLKKDVIRRLFPKGDQETFEIFEKGLNIRQIKFLVCGNCFYILTGSTVASEDEANAAKYRNKIEIKLQRKKEKAQFEDYIKHIKAMQMKEAGLAKNQNFMVGNLS